MSASPPKADIGTGTRITFGAPAPAAWRYSPRSGAPAEHELHRISVAPKPAGAFLIVFDLSQGRTSHVALNWLYTKGLRVADCVMYSFLKIFIVVVLALALIDWFADRDRRADTNIPNATPGWTLLSGDIKPNATSGWTFLSGNIKIASSPIANENPNGTIPPGQSFLPGDIKYESPNGNVRIYFPIVTSIVLSILFTLILRFIYLGVADR